MLPDQRYTRTHFLKIQYLLLFSLSVFAFLLEPKKTLPEEIKKAWKDYLIIQSTLTLHEKEIPLNLAGDCATLCRNITITCFAISNMFFYITVVENLHYFFIAAFTWIQQYLTVFIINIQWPKGANIPQMHNCAANTKSIAKAYIILASTKIKLTPKTHL